MNRWLYKNWKDISLDKLAEIQTAKYLLDIIKDKDSKIDINNIVDYGNRNCIILEVRIGRANITLYVTYKHRWFRKRKIVNIEVNFPMVDTDCIQELHLTLDKESEYELINLLMTKFSVKKFITYNSKIGGVL